MRSALVAALAVAAGLVLATTFGGAVTRAHAQVTAPSIFFGFIDPDESGVLPVTVRATISDVTCGTTEVIPVEGGLGFYFIGVASAATKVGCGVDGSQVAFLLLAGEVDEGTRAAQSQAWRVGTHQLNLSPIRDAAFGVFIGDLPAGPGIGFLRWTGASATPVEAAIATMGRDVASLHYWDVAIQGFRVYIPGAPAVVSTYLEVDRDDIVAVRIR